MPDLPVSNILSEAEPLSMQELFSRSPPLTDSEIDQIIAYMRDLRDRIEASPTRPRASRVAKPAFVDPNTTFEDLGL